MKKLTTTLGKLFAIPVETIRFNAYDIRGWCNLQEDFEFTPAELKEKVTVTHGYTGHAEDSCNEYAVFSINFTIDGLQFGNSVSSKSELLEILQAIKIELAKL